MKQLDTTGPAARPDRPGTQLLHDEANARVVCFRLDPGQEVAPHANPSTVIVQVLEGEGLFCGCRDEVRLGAGAAIVYEPGEVHSMKPVPGSGLRFLAIITPGPR